MNLDQTIRVFLKSYKNKIVSLDELEKLCTGQVRYLDFAQVILELLKEEILTPVKNSVLLQKPHAYITNIDSINPS